MLIYTVRFREHSYYYGNSLGMDEGPCQAPIDVTYKIHDKEPGPCGRYHAYKAGHGDWTTLVEAAFRGGYAGGRATVLSVYDTETDTAREPTHKESIGELMVPEREM